MIDVFDDEAVVEAALAVLLLVVVEVVVTFLRIVSGRRASSIGNDELGGCDVLDASGGLVDC